MSEAIALARAQLAFTLGFHILLPTFSIGLASYLATLEGLWLATGRKVYFDVYNYWLRIFAVAFAMGVVSGLVLSYEFGTNWARFADKAGPIIGPRLHFLACCVVAIGTVISAFWILSAGRWPFFKMSRSI
jgi:cytochrome bd ubiquinol oxidase subunit I